MFKLRITKQETLIMLCIALLSLFLNLYQIDRHIMFIGDFGRDYLAARDMVLTGHIPLVGIPSSVTWLHQGPLSIYIIGLSFILGNFNPIAPAVTYALIGVGTSILVYFLGKEYGSKTIGIFAAFFYATSPLIVINSRMPYHTSPIPFFACVFFLLLVKVLKGEKKLLPLLFFILGVLLQFELSNAVLFVVLFVLFILKKPKIQKNDVLISLAAFLTGILPFILYDLTHNFVQTVGFPLWVVNRIRLSFLDFFGVSVLKTDGPNVFLTIYQQLTSAIFPFAPAIALIFIAGLFFLLYKSISKKSVFLIPSLWIVIPLFLYLIHRSPGTAYFPLLFPAIALFVGYMFSQLIKHTKLTTALFVVFIFINANEIIAHKYYITTEEGAHPMPPIGYNFGYSIQLIENASSFIVQDSMGKEIAIKGGGFASTFATSVDNYKYLALYKGARVEKNADTIYTVYENKKEVPDFTKIVYSNKFIYVTKNISE